jgi:restriction-modification system family protein
MSDGDPSAGMQSAFAWKVYPVSAHDKTPLQQFVRDALELRGCTIVHMSPADRAPFFIVLNLPGGERMSILAYAFLANAKVTRNRPIDEHRFQVKYGGDLSGVIDVATDPHGITTTIFLGIDLERKIFIAADPLMNNPSPMSRSIEFKAENVDRVLAEGWSAWERERREARTTTRRAFELLPDIRTEILIGGRQHRLLDLILLERVALGLDPGERHLVADKFRQLPDADDATRISHKLLDELQIAPEALLDLISSASRLKMAVRGWVAESHLETHLKSICQISECTRLQGDGRPDISLRWKGGQPILVECKNVLRTTYAGGIPKLDFQRTRASKSDPCSRYYSPDEFQVVAACIHPITETWTFKFALTTDLPPHTSCTGRIDNNIRVGDQHFSARIEQVLDRLV